MKKIYYKLEDSKYSIETDNFIYYFSSLFYLNKFKERQYSNREDLQYKLSSRFNIEVNASDYFDFILYTSIEKRGFRIIEKKRGGVFNCLKEVKLNGMITNESN